MFDHDNEPPRWPNWLFYGVAVLCMFGLGWIVVEASLKFFRGH